MPFLLTALLSGVGLGWWGTTKTVEATTGAKGLPWLFIFIMIALYAWHKGWIK
ncbi:hypothetical protein L3V35_12395 [Vibrio sp. L5-1]|jgi:hypothetical protein|uniref:hypothetical protein n=1 Tax=Vibrio TaxID=662 RepID=UPI00148D38C2|nr:MULTISPECIES: hypothetical protein [Vibrio]MCF7495843.1 hypothetical protein [Vibrio sp. L5-1]CAK2904441.1 conserved hypothetical protein [Vibrio crassostreae]